MQRATPWSGSALLSVALLALLFLPLAGAHGDEVHWEGERLAADQYLGHLRVWEVDLAPNGTANVTLAFPAPGGGVPIQEDWLLLFRAHVTGAPVQAAVLRDHTSVAQWTWAPGNATTTTRAPATDFLSLHIHNLGAVNATVKVYYDQTCECTLKGVPMQSGPLLFNAPPQEGVRVHYNFTLIAARSDPAVSVDSWDGGNLTVRVRTVEWDDAAGAFASSGVQEWHFDGDSPLCAAGNQRFNACVEYDFVASGSGGQALWFEMEHDRPGWGLQVSPQITTEEPVRGISSPAVLWAVFAVVAVAGAARRMQA